MLYKIKRIFKKIYKILCYLPLLWRDEDWDYEYMLLLLRHKINNLGTTILGNNIIKESKDVYNSTQKVVKAIDKFLKSDEVFADLYSDKYDYIADRVYYDTIYNDDNTTSLKAMIDGRPTSEKEDDLLAKFYQDMFKFEQETWDNIWDLIKQHGRTWWD